MKSVEWKDQVLHLIDQTLLPAELKIVECHTYQEVADSIKTMKVRGAPAIGVAAAYGLALAAIHFAGTETGKMIEELRRAKEVLARTRPTAVNLFWALARMERVWQDHRDKDVKTLKAVLENEARAIDEEDQAMNRRIGDFGKELIPAKARILTHCNAGALATAGYGTALGVIRAAQEAGKEVQVYADETRPLLQGARLTAWELMQDNIPVTLITDSMAGYLMQQGKIDLVIVGADRITANGDVANKIGTYSLAVLANYHKIPFCVAAPLSTIDMDLRTGREIPIEERHHDEIRRLGNLQLAPKDVKVYNPAFDVTPSSLIEAIITDQGIVKAPYEENLAKLFKGAGK
ncbi:MAG: S-methyl-5-thioribose-1-phosphate isomerase [Bacillota bacterium]|uniref:Methylthioribose-1-phosphate isomerase n=1 Tax=Thermanaerosceptrum fracticalcis TaxID=1712410 RepID=A0A7G6E1I6_THEFR|nr:S-methyl-5-thioribose-1-phosphate isomerase [Thermanaerosceptrum fracticalcis]QNB45940.1 S-methyl-5-thioribose-1-phosphate isomerase [Thermanaerosceptrum fracticalcis]